jgi:predicted phage terminase large subunit-like protein
MDPLYQINNSRFGSVIFRRTTKQIQNEGGLWDTACDLYTSLGDGDRARMVQNPVLTAQFPSGMKVGFHHMEHEKHRFDWQGSQLPDAKFDELTQFTWKQFNYILGRLRSDAGVNPSLKGTCNPDPDSWVRSFIDWYIGEDGFAIPERSGVIRWFIVEGDEIVWGSTEQELIDKYPSSLPKSFTFIRSSVYDNKILLENNPRYLANLHALNRVERAQLLDGNWDIRPTAGTYFRRSDFEIVERSPARAQRVRAWDLAGTKRSETQAERERKSDSPDWTVGLRLSKDETGTMYVEHIERFREDPGPTQMRVKNVTGQDGQRVKVRLPQDPGQAGKAQAKGFIVLLSGYTVVTYPVSGSKQHRASPVSTQAQAGNIKVVRGPWNEAFFSEVESFPEGLHDDQVDALSDAFDELNTTKRIGVW